MSQDIQDLSSIIIERLKSKDLSIEKLSELTGVSEQYITLLVKGDFEKLPATPYVHGYISRIAPVLGLDGEELWKEYVKNNENLRRSGMSDKLPVNRFASKGVVRKLVIGVVIIIPVLAFVFLKFFYLSSPRIDFENLQDDITAVEKPYFTILGSLDPSYKLSINDEEAVLDERGSFRKEVFVESGFNTIIFKAKKILGKEHVFVKQIFYQKAPEVIAPTSTPLTPEIQEE